MTHWLERRMREIGRSELSDAINEALPPEYRSRLRRLPDVPRLMEARVPYESVDFSKERRVREIGRRELSDAINDVLRSAWFERQYGDALPPLPPWPQCSPALGVHVDCGHGSAPKESLKSVRETTCAVWPRTVTL